MTGEVPVAAQNPYDALATGTDEGEGIEVTFSPAEPQLTLGAARAILAMLLHAGEKADRADGRRT
jgi:hypothetical protein